MLVLKGRMGEAIEATQTSYPGLLERNSNLLFMLKCRQFIEMVNGTDSEVRGAALRSPRSQHGGSNRSSPSRSPVHHSFSPRVTPLSTNSGNNSPNRSKSVSKPISNSQKYPQTANSNNQISSSNSLGNNNSQNSQSDLKTISEETMNAANIAHSNLSVNNVSVNGNQSRCIEDVEMLEGVNMLDENSVVTNGDSSSNGQYMNGESCHHDKDDDMGRFVGGSSLYQRTKMLGWSKLNR